MKLIWHGHACFELISREGSIVFDPYAKNYITGLKLPLLTADMVICSHQHKDHNAADCVELTGKGVTAKIEQLETFHDEVYGAKRGKNTVTVVEAEGLRIAHMGDLGHLLSPEQVLALGRIDVLLVPVGGYYTIDAAQAKEVAEQINPRVIIPMHYSGNGFGVKSISTEEPFLELFPEEMICRLASPELEVELPERQTLIVFPWP